MTTGRVAMPGSSRAALYAGGFIGPFGGGMVTVLIPELGRSFHASAAAVSLSLTAYMVPFAALQMVSGTIGERLGRGRALRGAYTVYLAASLAAALANGLGTFLATRALQGAANAFTTPLALAGLAGLTPAGMLGRAMGAFAAVQTAGTLSAPLVAGLVGGWSWRAAFVLAGAAALLLALVPLPLARAAPAGGHAAGGVKLRDALTARTAWCCVAAFFAYMGGAGIGIVVALRASDAFHAGPGARGLVLATFGVAGVLVGRPAGALVDRAGGAAVAGSGALLSAALLPLLSLAPDPAVLALLWFAAGIASQVLWTGLNTLIVRAAPANLGGAVSVMGAFKFAGYALAPLAWLPLYAARAWLAFACAGAASLLVAGAVWRTTGSGGPT
jgi:MFS family permease